MENKTSFKDFVVNYDPNRDELTQYRRQKYRHTTEATHPVGTKVTYDRTKKERGEGVITQVSSAKKNHYYVKDTKTGQTVLVPHHELELRESFSPVHPKLKKDLGVHGDHATGMAGSDKGVAVSFDRPKDVNALRKQMSQHGYHNVTQVNDTSGKQKHVYHFQEARLVGGLPISVMPGGRRNEPKSLVKKIIKKNQPTETETAERFAIINDKNEIEVYNRESNRLIRKVKMPDKESAIKRLESALYEPDLDTFRGKQIWYSNKESGLRFSKVDKELEESKSIIEGAPKIKDDFVKTQREKDKEHADAMGRHVKSGRKKTMSSTKKSLADIRGRAERFTKEEVEQLDELSKDKLYQYYTKNYNDRVERGSKKEPTDADKVKLASRKSFAVKAANKITPKPDSVKKAGAAGKEASKKSAQNAFIHDKANSKKTNEEVTEAMNLSQRRRAALRMKKIQGRVEIGAERARHKVADPSRIARRARKAARTLILKKMTKGVAKKDLDWGRREAIEKRLDRMKGKIGMLAKRLLPVMRKRDMEKRKPKPDQDKK